MNAQGNRTAITEATMTAQPSDKAKPGRIGRAIRIRGKLKGEEDLVVEGGVEGTLSFKNNHLTIERSAIIKADVDAKEITIMGEMVGNTVATSRAALTRAAKVAGDIRAPRLVIEEGAKFRGAVFMEVPLPPGLLDEAPARVEPPAAVARPLPQPPPLPTVRGGAEQESPRRPSRPPPGPWQNRSGARNSEIP